MRNYIKGIEVGGEPDNTLVVSARVSCSVSGPDFGDDPSRQFGAVLFIEKEGFHNLFESVELQQRYDIALMSTKGHTVVAARHLVDELCGRFDLTLFVLHDFDVSGLQIINALRRDTRRYTYNHKINVVDLGVTFDDIQEHSLPSEYVSYGKSDPRKNLRQNGATEDEIEFLYEGAWRGSEHVHHGKRVELNAFRPRAFVEWVESKLKAHGVKKVVPGQDVLTAAYRSQLCNLFFRDSVKALEKQAIGLAKQAKERAEDAQIPMDLVAQVTEGLIDSPRTWKDEIAQLVELSGQ